MKASWGLVLGGALTLGAFGLAPARGPLHAQGRAAQARPNAADTEIVYIGTWGSEAPPPGGAFGAKPVEADGPVGIYAARLDTRTGSLAPLGLQVPLQRADWLTVNPRLPVLYSVAASPNGGHAPSDIYSFRIDPQTGKLTVLDEVGSGGEDATTMAFDRGSNTLIVGNHGSGDVSALPVHSDGSVGAVASLMRDYGKGLTDRQRSPAAHGVIVDPTHRYVLVADFGADRIFVYRLNATGRSLTRAQPPYVSLPAGSGPRHLAFSPDGRFLFLDTELSAAVSVYRWDANRGHLHLMQTLSPFPATYKGERGGAEIAVSPDGHFLYFSVRDHQNALFVYAIDSRTGAIRQIQRTSAGGRRPWSFAIDPSGRWMVVANMGSQALRVLRINRATGRLSLTGQSMSVPNPAAVAFYAH